MVGRGVKVSVGAAVGGGVDVNVGKAVSKGTGERVGAAASVQASKKAGSRRIARMDLPQHSGDFRIREPKGRNISPTFRMNLIPNRYDQYTEERITLQY
jgi:hypothetical protein